MKETTVKTKTVWEKTKESFGTALMSAGIVLAVLLLLWIPFKLIPAIFGNGSNFVSTTLSSLFISGDATTTENVATTTNDAPIVKTNTQTNTVQTQKVYFGKSDLQVTLIGTGIIDPASGQFVTTNYAGSADEIGIKFEVKNIGTNVSGPWKLRIVSPSRTTPYYDSAYQTSIKPGDRIVYTTSFNTPVAMGVNTAYITADPLNMVNEVSEANNQIIVPIKIDGTYYAYGNNYNYGNSTVTASNGVGTIYTWSSMSVNCYANPQTSYVGVPITWYATASGGTGYYTYSWTGTDLLNGNQNAVSKSYNYPGSKIATVTVTSNGTTITKQCSAYIY